MTSSRFILIFLAIVALALIVFAAISTGALLWLVIGVVVIGSVSIVLARIGVNLFGQYTDAVIKRESLRLDHVERMAKIGYLPSGDKYQPLQLAGGSFDIPVSTSGETVTTVTPYSKDALELLALSKLEMGENSNQVIPFHRARHDDYFRDVKKWTNAVKFLLISQLAEERFDGNRKLGTFCKSGTIGQLYERMKARGLSPHPG